MKPITLAACGLPVALCLFAGLAQATTLDQALLQAQRYSAALSANDHQINALENMAQSARQLPDPKLQFGIENVPVQGGNNRRLTREGMTMQRIGVMQEYISGTKRERKAQAISAQAREAAATSEVIRARLQRETAQAWFSLAFAQQNLNAVRALVSETARQTGVLQASLASGSDASSVLEARLTLSAMKNEEDAARRDVQVAQATLMKLTGEKIVAVSGAFPRIERLPAQQHILLAEVKQHPEIVQAAREAQAAQARSGESEVAAIPDVGIEVYYGKRADGMEDMAGVMFTVDLPLFQGQRQDKDHAANLARGWQANDQLAQLTRDHEAQIATLIAQYQAASAVYQRQVDEVLPLLEAKVRLSLAQYQAGSIGIGELLAARRDRLNGEIARYSARKAMADAWADIRYLTVQEIAP